MGKRPAHGPIQYIELRAILSLLRADLQYLSFIQIARAFEQDLAASKSFLKKLDALDKQIGDILRWPEAVTYEEMNWKEPSWLSRAALKFAHEQGWGKKTTAENLPDMVNAAQEAGILPKKK